LRFDRPLGGWLGRALRPGCFRRAACWCWLGCLTRRRRECSARAHVQTARSRAAESAALPLELAFARSARFAPALEHTLLMRQHEFGFRLGQEVQAGRDRADIPTAWIALERLHALRHLIAREQLELYRDLAEQAVLRMHPTVQYTAPLRLSRNAAPA
jgi:hypothetical protein